jgi:hypothetical protein
MTFHHYNIILCIFLLPGADNFDWQIIHSVIDWKCRHRIQSDGGNIPEQISTKRLSIKNMNSGSNHHHKLILMRIVSSFLGHKLTKQKLLLTQHIIPPDINFLTIIIRVYNRINLSCLVLGSSEIELEIVDFIPK